MPALLLRFLLLCWGLPFVVGGVCRAAPLETIAAARALNFSAAAAGQPVVLTGVVTYLRDIPSDFNFNLHDATGGLMVYPNERKPLLPGQSVAVNGVTAMSVHGLRITNATLVPGPMESLPAPVQTTMAEVLDGRHEGEFAEMEGVIRAVRLESLEILPQRLSLDFGSRSRRLNVWVTNYAEASNRFAPGARVRVRGVIVRWKNPRGQTQSTSVLVNSVTDVTDVSPAPAPVMQPLHELQLWSGPSEPATRVATRGVVTYYQPHELLVVQEGDRAIRIQPTEAELAKASPPLEIKLGEMVTVSGFPVLGEYTVALEDALIETMTPTSARPAPEDFTSATAVLNGNGLVDRDARLIRLRGTLSAVRERDGRRALEMTSDGHLFTAWVPLESALPDQVGPGAELALTGICTLHLTDERRRLGRIPDQFSLMLTGPESWVILRPAPWWNQRTLFIALGLFAATALITALWATLSARKNARLRAEISRREKAEHQLASDRRRVAGDLHDTLQQTLMAASLQLNAAGRTLDSQPANAATRVALAQQLLERGRQEVRDAVWDLHAGEHQQHSLTHLLTATCQEAATTNQEVHISFTASNEPPPLPALLVSQCTRLVREALANSLKHGMAPHVQVTLEVTENHLVITITDDGQGFDPTTALGPESGHFGLSSMRERTQRLGGTFKIQSILGQGTTLTVSLPLPPP